MTAIRETALAALVFGTFLASTSYGQATQLGSTLDVQGSPAEDVITIVFDADPGVARVFGVPGTPDGTQFVGVTRLVARTLASADILNVQSLSATPPELDVDTGTGDSQVRIDIQTPFGLTPTYSKAIVRGAQGKDSVLFNVDENAFGATYDWTVLGGDGENDATVKFLSDVLGGTTKLKWRYFGGISNDKVLVDFVTKADSLELDAAGLTGEGDDEWFVKASGDVNTVARIMASARMAGGTDSALVDVSNCGTTLVRGSIDGGDGDDTLQFLTTSDFGGNQILSGGRGNDAILFNLQQDLLPTSLPRVLAGEGNDTVSMLVSGAVLGSPFSDGGPGVDSFVGVGTAVNFE